MEITGKVIKGEQFGRQLGFPTANLDRREYLRKQMKIKLGVWAGEAIIINSKSPLPNPTLLGEGMTPESLAVSSPLRGEARSGCYDAAIVIGPIDRRGLPKLEAHLIGFKGNLYGKKMTIILKKYLRPFAKYKNIEDLKKQIAKDVEMVKKLKL